MGLRLSSRCRPVSDERWRAPLTASRDPIPNGRRSPRRSSTTNRHPSPVGASPAVPAAVACRAAPPHPRALYRPASGRYRARPRSTASARGGRLRRRGAAPGVGGDRPAQADRAAAAAADAAADRHGRHAEPRDQPDPTMRRCCAGCGCAPRPSTTTDHPSAAEVFATYTRGRRVRAIAAPHRSFAATVAGGWWPCRSDETPCRQAAWLRLACRETPSASNASSRRRPARSSR